MKNTILILVAFVAVCIIPQMVAAWDTGVCGAPPCTHTYTVMEPPTDPDDVGDFHKLHCSTGSVGDAICAASGSASGCASATNIAGWCSSVSSWMASQCTGTVSESFYTDCEYASGVYYCADGAGAPDVPVEHTDCYYIDYVTSWSVCSSTTPHWQYATGVHITHEDDSDSCSNAALSQWCNTPPTAPQVRVDYGAVVGTAGVTESHSHVPVQGSLTCHADGSTDADGDTIRYNYVWSLNGNSHASTLATLLTANTIPYPHAGPYDETWRCGVGAYDPWAVTSAEDSIKLINLAPSQPAIKITWPSLSALPDAADDLTCSITAATVDPEGEQVYYVYQWLKNGVAQPGLVKTTGKYLSGQLPVETYTISHVLLRPLENWTCKVTPYDIHDLNGPSVQTMFPIRQIEPCDGQDNDIDGRIDEGSYSCQDTGGDPTGRYFKVGDRTYCFYCGRGTYDQAKTKCASLNNYDIGNGQRAKGYLGILGSRDEDVSSVGSVIAKAKEFAIRPAGTSSQSSLYIKDDCRALVETFPNSQPSLYTDSSSGYLNCEGEGNRLYLDATGGIAGNSSRGKINDGSGNFGALCEFTEKCDGVDNDGDGMIDEGGISCDNGDSLSIAGKGTYCVSCAPVSTAATAANNAANYNSAAVTWTLADLNNETASEIKKLIDAYYPQTSVYQDAPKGLYLKTSCSNITDRFKWTDESKGLIFTGDTSSYGWGNFPNCQGKETLALVAWADLLPMDRLAKIGSSTGSESSADYYYGAVYETNSSIPFPSNSSCGNNVFEPALGEQCDTDGNHLIDQGNCSAGFLCDMRNLTDAPPDAGPSADNQKCVCKSNGTIGTYCGDDIRQAQNDVHSGGPADDGKEDCDGTDISNCAIGEVCDGCACVPGNGTGYCGDGIVQSPETCDMGNGSNCLAGEECAAPGEASECACIKTYDGEFLIEPPAYTDIYPFEPKFKDKSGIMPGPISWTFRKASVSGNCTTTPVYSKDGQVLPIPRQGLSWTDAGTLTISTNPLCGICAAEITATSPGSLVTITNTYIVNTCSLAKLCPNCVVRDIPAIIHPIGQYSTSSADSQKAYDSALYAFNNFAANCASACKQAAQGKRDEAQANIAMADSYNDYCSANSLCRLSQYYSARAKELVNEGLALM